MPVYNRLYASKAAILIGSWLLLSGAFPAESQAGTSVAGKRDSALIAARSSTPSNDEPPPDSTSSFLQRLMKNAPGAGKKKPDKSKSAPKPQFMVPSESKMSPPGQRPEDSSPKDDWLGIKPEVLLQPHFYLKSAKPATQADGGQARPAKSARTAGKPAGSSSEPAAESTPKTNIYFAPTAASDQRFSKLIDQILLEHFRTHKQAQNLERNLVEARKRVQGKKPKHLLDLEVAEKARQIYVYDLHTRLTACLSQIAMSLGVADKARAKEIFTGSMGDLRSIVSEQTANETAKAITAYVRSVQVPDTAFAGVLWSDVERDAKLKAIEEQMRVQKPNAKKAELKMLDTEATQILNQYKFALLTQNKPLLAFTREMIGEMTNLKDSQRILTSHLSVEAPITVPKLKLEPDDDDDL